MIDEKALLGFLAHRRDIWEDVDDDRESELRIVEKKVRELITDAEPQDKLEGFHLQCMRCGRSYFMSFHTMDEAGYTRYTYCSECLRRGIDALNERDME